jgi:hypothetical protein
MTDMLKAMLSLQSYNPSFDRRGTGDTTRIGRRRVGRILRPYIVSLRRPDAATQKTLARSRRLMKRCRDARRRLVISDAEYPINDLDPLPGTPTCDKGARKGGIEEIHGERVIEDAAGARWRYRPRVGSAVGVQPCIQLVQPTTESVRRDRNPDPNGKPAFRF